MSFDEWKRLVNRAGGDIYAHPADWLREQYDAQRSPADVAREMKQRAATAPTDWNKIAVRVAVIPSVIAGVFLWFNIIRSETLKIRDVSIEWTSRNGSVSTAVLTNRGDRTYHNVSLYKMGYSDVTYHRGFNVGPSSARVYFSPRGFDLPPKESVVVVLQLDGINPYMPVDFVSDEGSSLIDSTLAD
jgi:hypothetical protein